MLQKGYDLQDANVVNDNWVPPYTIEEIPKKGRWENILSQEEISELLSVLDKEDGYARGAVWQHKDGGMYEIISKEPKILVETPAEDIQCSRKIQLVWYRVRFDSLAAPVYVRTQEHFEKSFSWIPESDLM